MCVGQHIKHIPVLSGDCWK